MIHTVTHTGKGPERDRERRAGGLSSCTAVLLFFLYMIPSIKSPIFSAALSCICRVAWV